MIYRLIVLTGPLKGQRITVDPEPMTLGRHDQCDIQLPDNEVALHHARLEHRGVELFIHDLGSMNKVIVNKHEVQDSRLKHGDILELGRTRLLVQAIVQAEVNETPDSEDYSGKSRRRRKRLALAAAALVIAGGTFLLLSSGKEDQSLVEKSMAVPPEAVTVESAPVEATASIAATEPAILPAEPVPAGAMTGESSPPLDAELRQIREDLSFIQQHLQTLNNSAQPIESATEPVAPQDSMAKPVTIDDVEATMIAVRDAMGAGEYQQADLMLEHIQLEFPDYLPAYEVRAELFEAWGMPGKAREQWTAILQRTTESELYRKAVVERIRLGRSDSQRQVSAHEAVRIQSIEQIRFQETTEYDEMRMVKVFLSYDRNLGPIDPEGVRLMVYFFDQDLDTSRIEISKLQPYTETKLSERHNENGEQFSLSASYVVPKGYYQRDHNTSRQRYYGFIARLHYFDRLIDEQARPPKLLEPAVLEAAGLAVHTAINDTGDQIRPATN